MPVFTQLNVKLESLQSHFILTMSHWSSGLPVCFLSQGTQVQIPRGVLMWNQNSPDSDVSLQTACNIRYMNKHIIVSFDILSRYFLAEYRNINTMKADYGAYGGSSWSHEAPDRAAAVCIVKSPLQPPCFLLETWKLVAGARAQANIVPTPDRQILHLNLSLYPPLLHAGVCLIHTWVYS